MGFDLIAYRESQDSATLVNIAALADDVHTVSGDNIQVPEDASNVAMIYANGANMTGAELVSASLQERIPLNIAPIDVSAEPTSPTPIVDLHKNPLPLDASENLRAQMSEDAAGASIAGVAVWLSDGPLTEIETSEIQTVRATGTTTLAVDVWTNVAITLDDELKAGSYQFVGMRAESASGILARAVFRNQALRPGCIAYDAIGDEEIGLFRNGGLGVWGTFKHNTIPTIDFLADLADTAETVWLDIIRTGD